jgi:hypothetical protein
VCLRDLLIGQKDRLGRMKGEAPTMMPVTVQDPLTPCAIVGAVTHEWFTAWGEKSDWKNEVTVRS